jgi:hypothetical protein
MKLFSIQFVSICNRTLAVWNPLLSQPKVRWAIILPKSTWNHQKSTSVYHEQRSRKFIRVWNSSSSARLFSCWSMSFGNMREQKLFKGHFQTHTLWKTPARITVSGQRGRCSIYPMEFSLPDAMQTCPIDRQRLSFDSLRFLFCSVNHLKSSKGTEASGLTDVWSARNEFDNHDLLSTRKCQTRTIIRFVCPSIKMMIGPLEFILAW